MIEFGISNIIYIINIKIKKPNSHAQVDKGQGECEANN